MSVELCLTWDDHHRTLIEVFETLLENSTLVDCTIAAEGQYLKAHKVVLSACSPYFEMLFTQESEKNPIVVLKDIKFQDLKALIDFIYRGKAQIPEDRLQDFTDAAESLQIKGLGGGHKKNTCENKAREFPNGVRQESFARKRSRTSCPRTEEITSVSSNATISNKNPRLENVSGSQLNNHSISLLPLSASGTLSPAATQHKVQKESSEARPSNAARSSVSPTVPPLQPVPEVYVPEAWIEPKTEVCMDEISIEGSDDCVEDTMIKDEVNNEEYENSTFPSPNEIVKEESGNSILMESVTETSNPVSLKKLNDGRKRIRGPTRRPTEVDEKTNNTSQDKINMASVNPIEEQRRKKIARLNFKRSKAEGMMQKFLHSSPLQTCSTTDSTNGGNSTGTPECSCHPDVLPVDKVNQLLQEQDMRWEQKIQQIVAETVANDIAAHLLKFDEKLTSLSISPESRNNVGMSRKVPIGGNFFCDEGAFNSMKSCESFADWATLLLVGTFGEERAKTYRCFPRDEGLQQFPPGFLSAAKELCRLMLMTRNDIDGNIEEMVSRLPGYLSRRAADLNGARNKNKGSRKKEGKRKRSSGGFGVLASAQRKYENSCPSTSVQAEDPAVSGYELPFVVE